MGEGDVSIKDYISLIIVILVIAAGYIFATYNPTNPGNQNYPETDTVLRISTTEPAKHVSLVTTLSANPCHKTYEHTSEGTKILDEHTLSTWNTEEPGVRIPDLLGGKNVKFCGYSNGTYKGEWRTTSFYAEVFNGTSKLHKNGQEPPFELKVLVYKDGRLVSQLPWKIRIRSSTAVEPE